MAEPTELHFPVRFDALQVDEDLAALPVDAATALATERDIWDQVGIPFSRLEACQDLDGTALEGCVKCDVPDDDVRWAMVFFGLKVDGRVTLVSLAYGWRHPAVPGPTSVYERAHHRRFEQR